MCPDFDLALTLKSGQVFRWKEESPSVFSGQIAGTPARISQQNGCLWLKGVSREQIEDFFALDADLPAITREIDVDPVIHEALQRYPGLRVIRQDPWECAASFMLSAYNNIPRLTAMIEQLCVRFAPPVSAGPSSARERFVRARSERVRRDCWMKYAARTSKLTHRLPSGAGRPSALRPARAEGERALTDELVASTRGEEGARVNPRTSGAGSTGRATLRAGENANWLGRRPSAHSFPRPEALAGVSERVLRACGLGYRAPYLKGMARAVASGRADLEAWRELDDEGLRRALLTLPGIGEKVVECVMLFAYGRPAAFPVDVWIGRAMREWYFRRRKVSDKKIREFARKRFGPHCGWAQQYLYCLARWHRRDSRI